MKESLSVVVGVARERGGHVGGEREGDGRLQRGVKKLLRVMEIFAITTVVIVSWVYTHVNTY